MKPCGQEWSAAVLQLPQPGHLCGIWSWVARRASTWERSLSAVEPSGRISSTSPRWHLLLPPVSHGSFLKSCPAKIPCPLSCVKGGKSWHCSALWRKGQPTAHSMAGNDIGLVCQTQSYKVGRSINLRGKDGEATVLTRKLQEASEEMPAQNAG